MKKNIKNKAIRDISGTFLLVIAVVLLFRYEDIRGGFFPETINLESTKGIITTSKVSFHAGSRGVSGYRFIVEYEFKVKDRKYVSDKVSYGNKHFREKLKAEEITNRYPIGKKVTVYYENNNPELSILEPKENSNNELLIALTIFGSFIIFLIGVLLVRLRNKPNKRRARNRNIR
tara:strand:+ start:121 stop:645 length:525 start_codon:yes stop_codon:yes gene_type:complete